jgi:hypothetical protein
MNKHREPEYRCPAVFIALKVIACCDDGQYASYLLGFHANSQNARKSEVPAAPLLGRQVEMTSAGGTWA